MAFHAVRLVAVEQFAPLRDRLDEIDVGRHLRDVDEGGVGGLPLFDDLGQPLTDEELARFGELSLGLVVELEDGPNQSDLRLAADREILDVLNEGVDLGFAQQRERGHRRARDSVLQNPGQVGVGRLVGPLRALELEDPWAVIAGIGIEKGGGRPEGVSGHAMTVGAVLAVEAVLPSDDVAANRAGGEP